MTAAFVLVGALSVYWPGDGHCGPVLACGAPFTPSSHHIAIRPWRGRCGARARVCSAATGRCVWTTVQDSGPWGLQCGPRWRVSTRRLVPPGCRRRAVVDLTRPVWRDLGSPPFLSRVTITIYPRRPEVT